MAANITKSRMRAPGHLGATAKKCWKQYAAQLLERDDLTDADLHTFEMFCVNFGLYREALETVQEEGHTTENSVGVKIVHPSVKVMNDAQRQLRDCASILGFDPISRKRFPVEKDEPDPLDELRG
ncbi:phage terminase small subunit P27 family [Vibrio crassostreae]|uniref:phage terminase small subunit P27 family n=1 Tax=Vibrio crassostreae TaxID=246167 RepID=UPI001043DC07|nr:phage terminase small subunit P27 family [Vibrio crassostreae]TCT41968.1 P27 family predicted phage terminase small subunit [Vibrio crassostreae]TCT47715.1 P27 family predicted phage terminase small subunit [Vibrio crassostreae]CAK2104193.1 Phage terminase, small subunit [Vibrio crassostreae]CAK2107601.1 Phage terminase, small subunit [Vibrio crassostreae]CAK2108942.1 Phage terminase, small subunit [Vibrio crassostreae]